MVVQAVEGESPRLLVVALCMAGRVLCARPQWVGTMQRHGVVHGVAALVERAKAGKGAHAPHNACVAKSAAKLHAQIGEAVAAAPPARERRSPQPRIFITLNSWHGGAFRAGSHNLKGIYAKRAGFLYSFIRRVSRIRGSDPS